MPDQQTADLPAAVLVLAAGFSRRFGADKRSALLPASPRAARSVLETALLQLGTLGWPLVLVLRADDQAFAQNLRDRLTAVDADVDLNCVFAADSDLGMGHSLAAGARALQAQGAERVLIALGDMPYLRAETLLELGTALLRLDPASAGVVRPRYRGQAGHPVGFSGLALETLAGLSGDSGARNLLQRWAAETHWVEVDDPGVVQDIDEPADLH